MSNPKENHSELLEELRSLRREKEALLEITSDAIITTDLDFVIRSWNRGAEALYGWSAKEAVGKRMGDLVPSFFAGHSAEAAGVDLKSTGVWQGEATQSCKDGSKVVVQATVNLVRDEVGLPAGMLAINRDVTATRHAEAKLRAQTEFTESALDAQVDTFFLFDPKSGKALRWNKAFRDVTGHSDEEIAELPAPASYYSPEDLKRVKAFIDRVSKDGRGTIELELICKDGRRVQTEYRVAAVVDRQGNAEHLISIGRDVSERKRSEESLRENERKYRLLFENMLNGFALHRVLVDENGQPVDYIFLEVNSAFEKLTGLKRDEVVGRAVTQVLPGIEREPVDWIGRYGHVALTGKERRFVQRADALNRWFSVLAYSPREGHFATIFEDITDRKTAEEALQASEKRFSYAMDATTDGLYDWNVRTGNVYYSPSYFHMLGYEPDEFPPTVETYRTLLHPEDAEVLEHKLAAYFASGHGEVGIELRFRTKAGQWLWVLTRGKTVERDEAGKPLRFVGTNVNIDARKKAEQALLFEKARAQQYLEVAGVMLIALDAKQRVTLINPAGCQLLGYQEDEILGKNWFETCITATEQDQVKEVFDQVVSGDVDPVEYFENEVVCKDGGRRLIAWHNSVLRNDAGQKVGVFSSGEDITERKAVDEALRASEEKFRAIVDNIGIGIALINRESEILELNRQMRSWYPAVDPEHRPACYRVFKEPPRDSPCESCPTVKTFRDGSVHEEITTAEIAGETRNHRIISSPILNPAGEVTTVIEMVEDITDRNRMEAQIAQGDRLASMGMLAAGVAHEINNPLSYVLYNLECLSEDFPAAVRALQHLQTQAASPSGSGVFAGEERQTLEQLNPILLGQMADKFRDALRGSLRIHEIARGLGTFSRVEEDQIVPVSLQNVIEAASSMAQNEIKYRARLVKDHGKLPAVMASDGRLSQVFLNLLVNAAHAIDEGDVEGNQIRVRTWVDGDLVCAEVRDSGSGIAPDHLGRVFEPFFSTKETGVGSGLGLAISKTIIEGYGGTIGVESELGVGSTFTIRLPMKSKGAKPSPARAKADSRHGPRGRILIVDDEAAVRIAMARMLSDHEVVDLESGAAAMRVLENDQAFDLIVCDMMMPKVSGMDLYEWLSRDHPHLAERVIFVTGGVFTPRAREFLRRVKNLRIEKPINKANLKKIVGDYVLHARTNSKTAPRD